MGTSFRFHPTESRSGNEPPVFSHGEVMLLMRVDFLPCSMVKHTDVQLTNRDCVLCVCFNMFESGCIPACK